MTSGSSYYWDLVLLVVILALATVNIPKITVKWSKPIFAEIEDKSALDSEGAIYVTPTEKTGADILMSLVVMDENNPYPKAIKINNGPVIKLDAEWMVHKNANIGTVFSGYGDNSLGNMLSWKVKKVEYVYSGTPHWHYILASS